jgi:hypothetical protein
MPVGLAEILKVVGVGTPFLYAAAVYYLFHRLDLRASGAAKKAVSEWFTRRYEKAEVASAMVEVFDRIYTRPLLGWRACLRSAIFTLAVAAVVVEVFYPVIFRIALHSPEMRSVWGEHLLTNVVSDYLSLFVIRRWLVLAGNRPFTALMTGPVIGFIIIGLCYAIRDIGSFAAGQGEFHLRYLGEWFPWWWDKLTGTGTNRVFVFAAFSVNLWLPLFALGVLVMQGLNYFLFATSKMQWFLKQGRHHPFDAIGYVLALVVFVVTLAIQFAPMSLPFHFVRVDESVGVRRPDGTTEWFVFRHKP